MSSCALSGMSQSIHKPHVLLMPHLGKLAPHGEVAHLVSHAELEVGAENCNEGEDGHACQVLADAVPHAL